MSTFENLPFPQKKIITQNNAVYFIDSVGDIRIFNLKKELINKLPVKIDNVKLVGNGFLWPAKNDSDEIYIGKDTIFDTSHILNFEELLTLLKILKAKRKLKTEKFIKSVVNFI